MLVLLLWCCFLLMETLWSFGGCGYANLGPISDTNQRSAHPWGDPPQTSFCSWWWAAGCPNFCRVASWEAVFLFFIGAPPRSTGSWPHPHCFRLLLSLAQLPQIWRDSWTVVIAESVEVHGCRFKKASNGVDEAVHFHICPLFHRLRS